jgi:thiol-disulfide isomerase/thioredoxin
MREDAKDPEGDARTAAGDAPREDLGADDRKGVLRPAFTHARTAPGTVSPGLFTRLGLAIVRPSWALTLAADRRHVGRSATDLLAAIGLVIAATQLRWLVSAVWLGKAVDVGLGVSTAIEVLTHTHVLTMDLALLVLGTLILFAAGGSRRNLGHAFDLACVTVLPLLYVELAATVVSQLVGVTGAPLLIDWGWRGVACAWMGALIALAIRPSRLAPRRIPPVPSASLVRARRATWVVMALIVAGLAMQTMWLARNLELVQPMTRGKPAPAFALPVIDAAGTLGDRVELASTRGKVTVLDFWATWCKPCIESMPKLDKLARSHPDVAVLAINIDDSAAARALFNEHGYTMKLLADDGDVSRRYDATPLPYTVIIDRHGMIHNVVIGTGHDLAAIVDAVRAEP